MKIQASLDNINYVELPDYADQEVTINKTDTTIIHTTINNSIHSYNINKTTTTYELNYLLNYEDYEIIKNYNVSDCNSLIFVKIELNNEKVLHDGVLALLAISKERIKIDAVNENVDNEEQATFINFNVSITIE